MTPRHKPDPLYRFDRVGNVVEFVQRTPRGTSPARAAFKAARAARRHPNAAAMRAVAAATVRYTIPATPDEVALLETRDES